MSLSRLSVTGVRNLHPVTLSLPRINILFGDNGSGKTSLLEAIHLLGLARSFRSIRLNPVITYEQPACTVFGQSSFRISTVEPWASPEIAVAKSEFVSMGRAFALPPSWLTPCRCS